MHIIGLVTEPFLKVFNISYFFGMIIVLLVVFYALYFLGIVDSAQEWEAQNS